MKKLVLLLLVMAMGAGMVFAASGPIHPPGAYSIEAVMAEYGVQQDVVTRPSDLAVAALGIARPPSLQAVMALYSESAIQPDSYLVYDKPPGTGQDWTDATTDYHLRC